MPWQVHCVPVAKGGTALGSAAVAAGGVGGGSVFSELEEGATSARRGRGCRRRAAEGFLVFFAVFEVADFAGVWASARFFAFAARLASVASFSSASATAHLISASFFLANLSRFF